MKRLSTLLLCIVGFAIAVSAQRMRIGSSNPTGIAAGSAYPDALFAAGDTVNGVELWVHDTATTLLVDVYPGPVSSYPTEITRRSPTSGNTWFVARAKDGAGAERGRELFYYPSLPTSTAGQVLLDLRPGPLGSHPAELCMAGGRLFFTADDGVHGRELWTSDGTVGGTAMVRDIVVGAVGGHPHGLTVYGNGVVFAATTAQGTELWKSDGTLAGTTLIRDIAVGAGSSTPAGFVVVQNRVFFAATTPTHGRELWASNGTPVGTVLIADVMPGSGSSSPEQLTQGPPGLGFTARTATAGRQLCTFDLATNSTSVRSSFSRGESIAELTFANKSFWFRAHTAAAGYELWRTVGAGVALVHDLRAGAASSFPMYLTPFGPGLLFRADNGIFGFEYWRTDGVTASLVANLRTADCPSRPSRLMPIGSGPGPRFLFSAKGNADGIELYETDGLAASQVSDIDPLAVLPGMHWGTSPAAITIDIKDAAPGRPGLLVLGTSVLNPHLLLPFVRGAIAVNLLGPTVEVGFTADNRGNANFTFPPITPTTQTSIIAQAVSFTSPAFVSISTPGSCNQGSKEIGGPGGPKVEGRICLDDESGEYSLCAQRVDANPAPAFIGLYQKAPGGDLELLKCYAIEAGELIEDAGAIEILLPLEVDDPTGRHLEMHLFFEVPTPESSSPGSLVTTSYC